MTDQDKMKKVMGYLIGYRLGSQMLPQMLPGIEADDVVAETLAKGVKDGISGDMDMSLIDEKVEEYQNAFVSMLQERGKKVGEANLEKGRLYMAENGKRPEVHVTDSGLQYEILKEGDGPQPAATDQVEVHYTGKLIDGTVFDSSEERGMPATFGVTQVIPGWVEALQLMKAGSKWRLFIPSNLAYGPNGAPGSPIGPNATLIFDVELLKVLGK